MEAVKNKHRRTEKEVQDTIELANLNKSELNNTTQVLCFTSDSTETSSNVKLLELDAHLLEVLNEGDCLSFRGEKEESVMLCTKDRTYEIKEAETSNSCLLVPRLKFAKETNSKNDGNWIIEEQDARGVFHTYYEVQECKPKLNKLLVILQSSSFKGMEYEKTIEPETLYDWDRLQNEIQASENELKQALSNYLIVDMNGYLRLVSFEYEVRAMILMLDLIEENSWELDEIDKETTYESLKELIPKQVFEILFDNYTEPSGKTKDNGATLYRYNEEKTCKLLAKTLLVASPVNEYNNFMEAWRSGSPGKMEPKEAYLNGIALVIYNKAKVRREVISFPESSLPENISERFDKLFEVKDKWTLQEITSYVSNLTTSNMNVGALLTKYARSSTSNGIKYYSSKYGK